MTIQLYILRPAFPPPGYSAPPSPGFPPYPPPPKQQQQQKQHQQLQQQNNNNNNQNVKFNNRCGCSEHGNQAPKRMDTVTRSHQRRLMEEVNSRNKLLNERTMHYM